MKRIFTFLVLAFLFVGLNGCIVLPYVDNGYIPPAPVYVPEPVYPYPAYPVPVPVPVRPFYPHHDRDHHDR